MQLVSQPIRPSCPVYPMLPAPPLLAFRPITGTYGPGLRNRARCNVIMECTHNQGSHSSVHANDHMVPCLHSCIVKKLLLKMG